MSCCNGQSFNGTNSVVTDINDIPGLAEDLQEKTDLDFIEGSTPITPGIDRVRLYAKADKKLYILNDVGLELELQTSGGSAEEWNFSTATAGAPASGQFRFNNAVPASATEIAIHQLDGSGNNQRPNLSKLSTGDQIYLCNAGITNCKLYDITAGLVDNTTWFSILVTLNNENNVANYINGEPIGFQFIDHANDLQTAYNVSSQPQISVSDALGALQLKNDQTLDTDPVLQIQDISGTTTLSVSGDGIVDMVSNQIKNLADPTDNQDAATKTFVANQFTRCTGLFTGGVITQASATTYDIASGTGLINFGGAITEISWSAILGNTLTFTPLTLVYINSAGNLYASSTLTPDETREYILIGAVSGNAVSDITSITPGALILENNGQHISDLSWALGIFNISGNNFGPNGANLSIDKSQGSVFQMGSNAYTDINAPNNTITSLTSAGNFIHATQTGAFAFNNLIDPDVYDVGGVVTVIPGGNNRWTFRYVYITAQNVHIVELGQTWYGTFNNARDALNTEVHVSSNAGATGVLLRCIIIVQRNATDLSDTNDVEFHATSRFGESATTAGSAGVVDLQTAYDNSTIPQILTQDTNGGLVIQNGQSLNTDDQINIRNIAGTTTHSIDGNGLVKVAGEETTPVIIERAAFSLICGSASLVDITSGNHIYCKNGGLTLGTGGFGNCLFGLSCLSACAANSRYNVVLGNNACNGLTGELLNCVYIGGGTGSVSAGDRVNCVFIGSTADSTAVGNITGAIGLGPATENNTDNSCVIGNVDLINIRSNSSMCDLGTSSDPFANAIISDSVTAARYLATAGTGIKIGLNAGTTSQHALGVAIGELAGNNTQGFEAVAVGVRSGQITQGLRSVSVGTDAGNNNQGDSCVAVGRLAGSLDQGDNSVSIGSNTGSTTQGQFGVAVGYLAANVDQGVSAIAIGNSAGRSAQDVSAVAIGVSAGETDQGQHGVAIGTSAGNDLQFPFAVAIGPNAGEDSQAGSVAIGRFAGNNNQGANSVALGTAAGQTNQASETIVINGTGVALQNTTSDTCVIKPIRSVLGGGLPAGFNIMAYNPTTGELINYT